MKGAPAMGHSDDNLAWDVGRGPLLHPKLYAVSSETMSSKPPMLSDPKA